MFSGVASYGALGHVSPFDSNNLILVHFGVGLKLRSKYCVVCEISWCKCQQLAFDQYCISHQAAAVFLKFAVSAP